ncbi:MAG TPA: zf-TFIIB domain-containing protein [Pyrinomonadaceae bacterium]|nr:zf-TFIIB domain-containing protein [Pyrinomonadaceae bacterium]
MGDAMDDRRKGLEEEYFHRKNKEAIEKMREKMRVAEEAKTAGTSSMQCPRCDGTLETKTFENVEVDICPKCGGLWLDSGELEQLTGREAGGGWLSGLWNNWNSE